MIFRRGPRWNKEAAFEDWIMKETGCRVFIEYIRRCEDVVKVWCDLKGMKEKILERREEWRRRGCGIIERWMSMEERKGEGCEGEEERKSQGRGREKEDARIRIEKRKSDRVWSEGERSEINKVQGWRLGECREDRAKENRKLFCNKRN